MRRLEKGSPRSKRGGEGCSPHNPQPTIVAGRARVTSPVGTKTHSPSGTLPKGVRFFLFLWLEPASRKKVSTGFFSGPPPRTLRPAQLRVKRGGTPLARRLRAPLPCRRRITVVDDSEHAGTSPATMPHVEGRAARLAASGYSVRLQAHLHVVHEQHGMPQADPSALRPTCSSGGGTSPCCAPGQASFSLVAAQSVWPAPPCYASQLYQPLARQELHSTRRSGPHATAEPGRTGGKQTSSPHLPCPHVLAQR
jgi:hypothetical protein